MCVSISFLSFLSFLFIFLFLCFLFYHHHPHLAHRIWRNAEFVDIFFFFKRILFIRENIRIELFFAAPFSRQIGSDFDRQKRFFFWLSSLDAQAITRELSRAIVWRQTVIRFLTSAFWNFGSLFKFFLAVFQLM